MNSLQFQSLKETENEHTYRVPGEGMDVNLKDPQTRYTPLMIAIMREEVSIVNCLLENGASMALINAGRHALHVAASARNPKILELLISHGAPLDAPAADGPDKGSTALDIALIRRAKHFGTQDHPVTINMLRCLLRAGAQFKGSEYLIIKPWMESPQRGSRFDQEDLELFLEFVRAGLDLKMEIDNLPDKRHTNPVTIEHAVVFHSSWSGVGSFLAQNLSIVPERRNQHHLMHTLCAGCFYNYSTRVEEDVNEAIETLLKRGLDPDLMDDTEYSPLNFLLDTVAWFNVDHPKRLGSLRTLLMHRANPCSGDGAVYPVRQVLEGPDYIAVDDSYVFDVIRLLLEYFSYSNMPYAPLWQREYLAEHLPITSNYKAYREGEYFEAMLIRHSGLQQSSVTIFRRAALAVSMRKFLEAQLSLGVSQRNYEDILEALTLQRDQKLPGEAMPRYFVIDVLSLLSQTSNWQFPLHQPFTESWDISAKSKGERTAGHIGHKEMISSHFRLP
ncbi:hypothetical protein SLS56_006903 [Neofusicoccum ribis]|uniref:Ankyrin repeat protein n=1 Tax=Neofusicoccum ribis TaxID=45134 RepID=A0ABR3SQX4_9PEZI